jgi:phosphoglycolate phosphatase
MSRGLPACILFDLDGTLVDSLPGIEFSIREAFHACHLPLPQPSLREMIGPPIRTILSRAGNVAEPSRLDALERAFRTSYDGDGWLRTACFPEAQRVLRLLREQGHSLFIVSNKPRHISLRILQRERILEYFEVVLTRDSRMPHYRGKDEMIAALLAERAIARDDCLVVGDTAEDAKAAAACGIQFIWMTHGYGARVEMSSIPVAHTLDSFSQFFSLITKEPVCD